MHIIVRIKPLTKYPFTLIFDVLVQLNYKPLTKEITVGYSQPHSIRFMHFVIVVPT